jgi:hypothetical protein
MAKIKSNAHLWLGDVSVGMTPTPVAITSITKATPPVVTPATMPVDLANGDLVAFEATGVPYLDGQAFRIDALDATTFTLPDAESSDIPAAVATGTFTPYLKAGTEALLEACMAQITVSGQAPDSIALDDMCSTMTILGDNKPPTFTFSGFVDQDSPGFENLVEASIATPKPTVPLLIDFSAAGGYIAGPAQIGEMTITAGVGQGLQFSGSGVFTEVPTYSWAL